MAKIKKETESHTEPKVVKKNKVESFTEKNRDLLGYISIGILAIGVIYFGYRQFVLRPQEIRAQNDVFMAQQYLEVDSLDLALYGDGTNRGFLDVADEYSLTATGNLAKYYAGTILLKKGEYQEAIDLLKSFSTKSAMLEPMKYGNIGDAYSQLQEYDQAVKNYVRAARADENNFTAPMYLMKAGFVYEKLGKFQDALDSYEKIKEKFPDSPQGQKIDKYISKAQAAIFSGK
jgi:tetratricopeptide (TPR) repeat protein